MRLADLIIPRLGTVDAKGKAILLRGMDGLKQRAKTLVELAENATFYIAARPLKLDEKATDIIAKGGRETIVALMPKFEAQTDWTHDALQQVCKDYAESAGIKLGAVAQPLRAGLSGKTVSPGVFEVMEILGKEESLGRLKDVC